jgi:hypothetical protein
MPLAFIVAIAVSLATQGSRRTAIAAQPG